MTKQQKLGPFILFFALLVVVAGGGGVSSKDNDLIYKEQTVNVEQSGKIRPLRVEMALTPEEWEHGLMFRTAIKNDGMLFIFPEAQIITMWMKNTLIPLDMVFFDGEGKVVHIHKGAVPESRVLISSQQPASMVLELPAGKADALGFAKGDTLHVSVD